MNANQWRRAVIIALLFSVVVIPPLTFAQSAYHVDGAWGNNSYDGLSAMPTNGHGPKQTVSAAITAASDGSTIYVAHGFCQETNWDCGTKTLTLVPQDSVRVYQSDPYSTSSFGSAIPDAYNILYNLSPMDINAPSQLCTNFAWAQQFGLSNLQVYQLGINPALINAALPVITTNYSPQPNANGWNHSNVSVWFTVVNAVYLTPSSTNSFTSETNNAQIVGTAVNIAGQAVQTTATIKIDKTPPTVSLSVTNNQTFTSTPPPFVVAFSDAGSGIGTQPPTVLFDNVSVTSSLTLTNGQATYSFTSTPTIGAHTWEVMVIDIAGNTTTQVVNFSILDPCSVNPSFTVTYPTNNATIIP